MMQYPNQYPNQYYQNQQMCNTENCKRCPRKQGCSKYLSYLENIASTPITMASPTLSNEAQSEINKIATYHSDIDLPSLNEFISSYQISMTELVTTNSTNIENKFKILLELNNTLTVGLSEMKNTIIELSEKISKLDSFIEMIELHNAQTGNVEPKENSVALYSDISVPDKVLVEKSKKGFLGFGKKTEWTEE